MLSTSSGPLSKHSLSRARHQSYLLIPSTQTSNQEKNPKNPELRSKYQQIVLYCLGLHNRQNLGLREGDLEPISKKGNEWQD